MEEVLDFRLVVFTDGVVKEPGLGAKKKGQNGNSAPIKNPISYEKPRRK
jgi:hypothetical protein